MNVVSHEPVLPLTAIHQSQGSGLMWFLALLVSTYALPFTHSDQLADSSLRFRTSGVQSLLPFRKTHSLGKRHAEVIADTTLTSSRPFGDWQVENRERYGLKFPDMTEKDSDSDQSYASLTTLKRINNWAQENRSSGLHSKLAESKDDMHQLTANIRARLKYDDIGPQNQTTASTTGVMLKKRLVTPYDKKVFVYGKDDRLRIYPPLLRKFPYSNIVRLSTGCTGTLVTPIHVLTAAHCVHTGYSFRNNLEMLKVEVPDTMGDKIYYIEKIGIPSKWLRPGKHEHQSFWDYAVVKLSYPIHGRSQFFPLAVPTSSVLNQNLQFLGFPNNEDDLWMSVCPAWSNKAMVDGNLILTRCDSAVGNSGAAVLSDEFREGKKIIGVLSSTMPVGRMPHYTRFSLITALTWTKLHDICAEIGEIGVRYHVCPRLKSIPRLRRIDITNNVIPFFGK